MGLEQGETNVWSTIKTLDELEDKVSAYLKAMAILEPQKKEPQLSGGGSRNGNGNGRGRRGGNNDANCETTDDAEEKEQYKKRIRRVIGGLRLETKEKISNLLESMSKLKPGGCFLHNHDKHQFLDCLKIKDLCEHYQCTPALTTAKASAAPTLSARRAQAQLKKDQNDLDQQREEMAEQQAELKRQMKANNDMMKVLIVTINSQALINNAKNNRSMSSNPFEGLEMHSDNDKDDADNNMDDAMDEAVDNDQVTNNDIVESYPRIQSSICSPAKSKHTILAKC